MSAGNFSPQAIRQHDQSSDELPSSASVSAKPFLNISKTDRGCHAVVAGSKVLFELPSPWYDTDLILSKIQEAKQKGCTVALDLTWLPISNDTIAIDLLLVDEIFFSMNKTWPISDLRPAFRWSKNKCNDAQTFQWEHCTYPKVAANVLVNLTKQYTFDYVYETYRDHASQLYKLFDLAPSSVLWFATHDSIKHNAQQPIWPDYYLDDFVCIRKLLEFKGKYFW